MPDELKMCSICIYFVTADNWIRILLVILASKSLRYRSVCIYEIVLIGVSDWEVFGVCAFSPSVLASEYLTALLM